MKFHNMPELTVCMFSNLYPPISSGSSIQCEQLARELAKRKCRVIVVTARVDSQCSSYEMLKGVHIYRLPAFRLPQLSISLNFPWLNLTFTPANTYRIRKIMMKHQPDVIHLHNHMFDLSFSAVMAARRFKKPLVITIHTVIQHPRSFYNWLLFPADRGLLKNLVIRHADVLICPDLIISDYVKEAFGRINKVLVPYGIYPPSVSQPETIFAIRQKYNIGNGPVILSLGHLHEIRNRKELIEIMPRLLERFPTLKLLIVGDIGTDSAEKLAKKLGVRSAVIFTGAVPHIEIPAYLGIADLEAHWFHENNPQRKTLGIAGLEAMAAGKVVLGTADENVYGNGILRDGENIILNKGFNDQTSLANCIIDLLIDAPRRSIIGQQASQTIREHFSWDVVCMQTINLYQLAIKRQGKKLLKKPYFSKTK